MMAKMPSLKVSTLDLLKNGLIFDTSLSGDTAAADPSEGWQNLCHAAVFHVLANCRCKIVD